MKITTNQSESVIRDANQLIINTARRFFSEYSYLGVSMDKIAKQLHVTKAALYYHFTGKAEIYQKVLDDVFNDLSLAITQASNEATIDKKLHQLIKNYLDFGFKEKNLVKALMLKLSPADSQITKHIIKLRKQIADLIQPIIKEMLASKKLTPKINSRLLTSLLTSMMDGLLLESSFLNKKISTTKISDQIIGIFF